MATVELTSAQSRSNGKAAQRIERVRAKMETDLRTLSAKKEDERDSEIASTLKQAYSRLTAATALASLCDQRATPPSPFSVAGSGAKSSSSNDFHPFGRIEGEKMEEIASNIIAAIDEPSYVLGDVSLTFAQKLMEILDEEDNEGAIAWLPHGKSFTICNRRKFTSEVMPKYFGNSKYSSFIRKLNRWGFVRNGIGAQDGAYHHVDFQRGRHNLCAQIRSRAATKFRVDSAPNSPMDSKNSLKQNRSIENEHMCNHGVKDASPQLVRNGGTYGDAALQLHPAICSPHSRSISIESLVPVNSLRNCVLSSSRIQQIGQVAMSNMSPLGSSRVAESTTMQIDPGSISGGSYNRISNSSGRNQARKKVLGYGQYALQVSVPYQDDDVGTRNTLQPTCLTSPYGHWQSHPYRKQRNISEPSEYWCDTSPGMARSMPPSS